MPDHPSLTALVAEDSAKQRDDLIADLTAMGLKPVGAKTGFEALKLVTGTGRSLLGRLASIEEVANMIAYVCSPAASATSGAALRVDGGVVRSIA